MNRILKFGDRVRLKDSVSFGTVAGIAGGSAGGSPSVVMVEWDGHEGLPDAVQPENLDYVRPPPQSWSSNGGWLPFCDP
jgi:hypothetical protein